MNRCSARHINIWIDAFNKFQFWNKTNPRYQWMYQLFIVFFFQVVGNIQTIEKSDLASGLVRIVFISPKLDVIIRSNPSDLETFIHTIDIIKDIKALAPKCTNRTHSMDSRLCKGQLFSRFLIFQTSNYNCPLSGSQVICPYCGYFALQSYTDHDAHKMLETWIAQLQVSTPLYSLCWIL